MKCPCPRSCLWDGGVEPPVPMLRLFLLLCFWTFIDVFWTSRPCVTDGGGDADGQLLEAEQMCTRKNFKNYRALLYLIHKQQYLEQIAAGEYQIAFTTLSKRLKQYENLKGSATEFQDLCYLLSCKAVHEAPSFRDWDSKESSRYALCVCVCVRVRACMLACAQNECLHV